MHQLRQLSVHNLKIYQSTLIEMQTIFVKINRLWWILRREREVLLTGGHKCFNCFRLPPPPHPADTTSSSSFEFGEKSNKWNRCDSLQQKEAWSPKWILSMAACTANVFYSICEPDSSKFLSQCSESQIIAMIWLSLQIWKSFNTNTLFRKAKIWKSFNANTLFQKARNSFSCQTSRGEDVKQNVSN